jgi:16S rRNA (uracil1498-N3)-methyltransferase
VAHFYLDESLGDRVSDSDAAVGSVVHLTGADARHAVTVARVRVGERLRFGDGAGLVVEGDVVEANAGDVALRVERAERLAEPKPRIVLVQALAKGDRDELAVQAATELGVDAIVPWQAARSVSRWDSAKAEKGRARWQSIVREASKQAIRARVPLVEPLATTAAIAARAHSATVLVLDPAAEHPLTALDRSALTTDEVVIVVGPEGGISADELAALAAAGSRGVRLGATVLRTSTAGPAAIAVLSGMLGRW